MATQLSPEDIDAVARRVISMLVERLTEVKSSAPAKEQPRETKPALKSPQLPPKLAYTLKELCAELGVSPVTIARLEARGFIKSWPLTRRKIYSRAEAERLIAVSVRDW